MDDVEIRDINEAKLKLKSALRILDAVSKYSKQVPGDQIFDENVCKQLRQIYPGADKIPPAKTSQVEISLVTNKVEPPIYPSLVEKEFSEDEIRILSPYCYKIANLTDFEDVLNGLKAHYTLINARTLTNKGELLDSIIRSSLSKNVKSSIGTILQVVGSLALLHIRNIEAKILADTRGYDHVGTKEKSDAAEQMWEQLRGYNGDADKNALKRHIGEGIRWEMFRGQHNLGIILVAYKLPPSLKTHLVKLGTILSEIPGVLDRAKKAESCVEMLLELSLRPWKKSNKRKSPIRNGKEVNPKRLAAIITQTERILAQNQTPDHEGSHQYDISCHEDSGIQNPTASHDIEPQHLSHCTSLSPSDQSSESTTGALTELVSNSLQGPETVHGGENIVFVQQAPDQLTESWLDFDGLWAVSLDPTYANIS